MTPSPLVTVFLLLLSLGASSTQELYGDDGLYSSLLGENFIDYPILEEYGFPQMEEFPVEDTYDSDDESTEDDNSEGAQEKKTEISRQDNANAQKSSSPSKSLSNAREKRQAPLQDDPVAVAREKLQRAIKAAQALTGIERELGLNPSTIENKTTKLEDQLKTEENNFQKLAKEADDVGKRQQFLKMEKVADQDVGEAESILKLIVKLEAAKYLAKERAREDLQTAEKHSIATSPNLFYGSSLSFPFQGSPYAGVPPPPPYTPQVPTYSTSSQPQINHGFYPFANVPSASGTMPPGGVVPPYQPSYGINAQKQPIDALNTQQASVSAFPSKDSTQKTLETFQPLTTKVAAFASEQDQGGNLINFQDEKQAVPPSAQKATELQPSIVRINNEASKPQNMVRNNTKEQQPSVLKTQPKSQYAGPFISPLIKQLTATPSGQPLVAGGKTEIFTSPIGQPGGLLSPATSLTASYSPSIVSPNPAPMVKFFDSSFDSSGPFAQQNFYQPLASPIAPPQAYLSPNPPKKVYSESPAPVKPATVPYGATYSDRPLVSAPPNTAAAPTSNTAAYLGQPSPTNAYNYWNAPNYQSNGSPQQAWSVPMYYPPPAPYQPPVNPHAASAYGKLQDTEKASLAVGKIEQAIGLSPDAVKHIIDVIEKQAKDEEKHYEKDMSNEKNEITKEKQIVQNDQSVKADEAKKIIKLDEAKLRSDILKENTAKEEIDKIKKIERILTIIEAAKYSAIQRAKSRLNHLDEKEEFDEDDIRKRDLVDLEKDLKKQRRNKINIWLKGSRDRINTSHFLRTHGRRLLSRRKERVGWTLNYATRKRLQEDILNSIRKDLPITKPTRGRLSEHKIYKALPSYINLESGEHFHAQRTEIPNTKEAVNTLVMDNMIKKMDELYKVQGEILKYLKEEHDSSASAKKSPKRWKRSLYKLHHHKGKH